MFDCKKMQVGDLVCYNAAGQKRKTLGLVLDVKFKAQKSSTVLDSYTVVLIKWCIVGDIMPRRDESSFLYTTRIRKAGFDSRWGKDITPGETVWHKAGEWFETIQSACK